MNEINTQHTFEGYVESRIGGRVENQDYVYSIDTPFGLLVIVCDGMGGGPGGKIASKITAETVVKILLSANPENVSLSDCKKALQDAIIKADAFLKRIVEEKPMLEGMGTTIAAIVFHVDSAVIAHVGDSRVYKVRNNLLNTLTFSNKIFRTNDHSKVGDMVRKGEITEEQARLSAESNIITRAIGPECDCTPDIAIVPYEKDDLFMLCSDGIWGMMPEKELIKLLCLNRNITTIIKRITQKIELNGVQKGGFFDNYTIALIQAKTNSTQKEKMNRLSRTIIYSFVAIIVLLLFVIAGMSIHLSEKDNSIRPKIEVSQEVEETRKPIQEQEPASTEQDSEEFYQEKEEEDHTIEDLNEEPISTAVVESFRPNMESVKTYFEDIKSVSFKTKNECSKALENKCKEILEILNSINKDDIVEKQKVIFNEIREDIKKLELDKSVEHDNNSRKYVLNKTGKNKVN
ncbi:MAG: serine/threonine-protein phosphatase, partial [Clostridia bacterium]|nr:serine/threonine-protein phosphatase [Clostridia bacterium]